MSSNDAKQQEIDAKTMQIVAEHGGTNYLNANYIHLFAEQAIGANDAILDRLQPDVDVDMNDDAWKQAMYVAVAFIKRYKLEETKETMKLEFEYPKGGDRAFPSKTGFSKAKDLDAFFAKIDDAIGDMKSRSFQANVDIFAAEAGLKPDNKPSRRSRREGSERSEKRSTSSHRHHRSK